MGLRYNPFNGSFDFTRSPGSYLDGEVATFADLPLSAAAAPLNSAWLVREASGLYFLTRKPAGIYIRTATGGTDRNADYTYASAFPDVFSDANFTVYDDADSTRSMQIQVTDNETLTFKVTGSDSIVRSVAFPLSAILLAALMSASSALAQNIGIVTGTNGTVITGRTSTLTFTNPATFSGTLTATGNVTMSGTANTAPLQTASSGASLMTRELTDTRMVDYIMQQPMRFRNLSHAIQTYTSGTGAAVHAGPITDGRVNARIVNGSTNSFAGIRVNRQGPWNGTEGGTGIEWARPMNVVVIGQKNISTNNVVRAFLVLGGGVSEFDVPTNGNFVALNWTNSTNAQVIVGRAGVLTTNATTITTSASPGQFGLWIDHSTNGVGNIYYAERTAGSNLQKPASPSASYTNGPAVTSSNSQVSLNFGIVGLSTNTGGSFEIVGLNNAIMFSP